MTTRTQHHACTHVYMYMYMFTYMCMYTTRHTAAVVPHNQILAGTTTPTTLIPAVFHYWWLLHAQHEHGTCM